MITLEGYERNKSFHHQLMGVQHLLDHPFAGLWDEMGAGKTKQTIDAAQMLFDQKRIDTVIVIAPASVRSVWYHEELGELQKHCWTTINHKIVEYHAKVRSWRFGDRERDRRLTWIITNYEFIRSEERLVDLLKMASPRTFLVLDESSAVKNHKAKQSKAVLKIRNRCGRVVLLNGTPIANNPGDLYAQGQIMSKSILDCKSWTHYKSRYAIIGQMKGVPTPVITGWRDIEDLQKRFAPFVIRRLKKDCLDLPPKLPPVTLTVTLGNEAWKIYKEMRDEMVAWLSSGTVASAQQAAVRTLRLAQITSGFVGGIESLQEPDFRTEEEGGSQFVKEPPRFFSTEKLDFTLNWIEEQYEADRKFKLLLWCRFVPELHRFVSEARKRLPDFEIVGIHGGQKRQERERALRVLDPRTTPDTPVLAVGTLGTGAKGLNLTAAHTMLSMSYDYSLEKYLQSNDRIHRPGQTSPVSYFDIVAVGPSGQRTIDQLILNARRGKEDVANFTTSAWIRAITQDYSEETVNG